MRARAVRVDWRGLSDLFRDVVIVFHDGEGFALNKLKDFRVLLRGPHIVDFEDFGSFVEVSVRLIIAPEDLVSLLIEFAEWDTKQNHQE